MYIHIDNNRINNFFKTIFLHFGKNLITVTFDRSLKKTKVLHCTVKVCTVQTDMMHNRNITNFVFILSVQLTLFALKPLENTFCAPWRANTLTHKSSLMLFLYLCLYMKHFTSVSALIIHNLLACKLGMVWCSGNIFK